MVGMSTEKNIITMQIVLLPDTAGFIGFECPRCGRYFKAVAVTFTASAHVHCAYRGRLPQKCRREQGDRAAAWSIRGHDHQHVPQQQERQGDARAVLAADSTHAAERAQVAAAEHLPEVRPSLVYTFDRDARGYPQCSVAVA